MSGYLIQGDPADQAFKSETDFENNQYDVHAKRNVDAAVRGGVGEMMDNGGSTYYRSPQAVPSADYQPPLMPVGTPTPGNGPAQPSSAPSSYPTGGTTGDNASVARLEAPAPGQPATNQYGYGGKYQFGVGALQDIGAFTPTPGAVPGGANPQNNWSGGMITLPGQQPMTPSAFFQNGAAQDQAMDMRRQWLTNWMHSTGLDAHFGQEIGGVMLTPETAVALAHFAGPGNFSRWVTSDGEFPFKDGNGVSIPDYAQGLQSGHFPQRAGGGPGGYQGPPVAAPDMGSAGGFGQPAANPFMGPQNPGFNARYDPILQRLAETPGGGATALQIMGQQSRYDMGMTKRQDTYARLAMTAAAKGDTAMLAQFAPLAGLNLPPQMLQNATLTARFGQASLAAERIYGADKQGASRFVNAYLQSGDFAQAATAAGPPANNPHLTVQQIYDGATGTLRLLGVPTSGPTAGQAVPITEGGQPVTQDMRPSGALQAQQWKTAHPAGLTPGDGARVFQSVFGSIMHSDVPPDVETGRKQAEQIMEQTFGPAWRTGSAAGGATQPANGFAPGATQPAQPSAAQAPATVPAPAAAIPAANPAAQPGNPAVPVGTFPPPPGVYPPGVPAGSQWSQQRQMFRDAQGNFYDRSGRPIPKA